MGAKVTNLDTSPLAPEIKWKEHDCDGHSVQFYAEDSSLLDELSGFVGRALEAGGSAIVIAAEPHRERLKQELRSRGLDTAKALRKGQFISLDAAGTLSKFMVEGYPDASRFVKVIGDVIAKAKGAAESKEGRVVAFGEMVALLWAEGKPDAAIYLEQLWNELAHTHSFSLRCAYPMTAFHREEDSVHFVKICLEHSDVIPADGYTGLPTSEERLRNIANLQQKEQAYLTLLRTKKELDQQIAEKAEAQRKLENSERSLRELSGRLLRMQDEERRHIGRELHDTIGQYLAALKMSLDLMKPEIESKENRTAEQLRTCLRLVEQSITEVRTMSYLLYPPMLEEMGLKTAVPWYLDGFSKRSGIRTSFEISDTFERLPRDVELAIFRVLQESLTNVLRHSGSPTVHIRMRVQDGKATVQVKDMGKGIPSAILESAGDAVGTLGVGLRGMNERMRQLGGSLELLSGDAGTTVIAAVPYEDSTATAILSRRYGAN